MNIKDIISITSEALAAISIVAAGASFTYDSWKNRQVSVTGEVVSSKPSSISLLITNNGGVDVALKKITITSLDDNIKNPVNLSEDGVLLEKGKSIMLHSKNSPLNSTVQYEEPKNEEERKIKPRKISCQAYLELVVAGEKNKVLPIRFDCYAASMANWDQVKQ